MKKLLTLSAHLGRLFVFVSSFFVTSLLPTQDLKQNKLLVKSGKTSLCSTITCLMETFFTVFLF